MKETIIKAIVKANYEVTKTMELYMAMSFDFLMTEKIEEANNSELI